MPDAAPPPARLANARGEGHPDRPIGVRTRRTRRDVGAVPEWTTVIATVWGAGHVFDPNA